MKKMFVPVLALLGLLALPASLVAGTQLIVHGQDLAENLALKYKPDTASTLLEALFDDGFNNGTIAFDTDMGAAGNWTKDVLGANLDLAQKNSAGTVVYFHLYWSPVGDTGLQLDKIEYQVWATAGKKSLAKGKLDKLDFTLPSKESEQMTKKLVDKFMAALKPALRSAK